MNKNFKKFVLISLIFGAFAMILLFSGCENMNNDKVMAEELVGKKEKIEEVLKKNNITDYTISDMVNTNQQWLSGSEFKCNSYEVTIDIKDLDSYDKETILEVVKSIKDNNKIISRYDSDVNPTYYGYFDFLVFSDGHKYTAYDYYGYYVDGNYVEVKEPSYSSSSSSSSGNYNKNDSYYSSNDYNNDGYLNQNEFQGAVNDWMNDHGY